MSRIKRTSPALVISILALVAALVVPALAQVATTALTKKEKRVVRKIARGQVKKLAPGLSVASARSAGDTAEVHSPNRIVVNDSVPGDLNAEIVNVVAAGAFTVRVQCWESQGGGANDVAGVVLTGPPGSSFSGGRTDGTYLNFASSDSPVNVAYIENSANQVSGGRLTVVAPNGNVVSVSASAEVGDPAGDCVFGVTVIGA